MQNNRLNPVGKIGERAEIIAVAVLFALLIFIGLFAHPDYGISPDEYACRDRAIINAKYITEVFGWSVFPDTVPALATDPNRDHGAVFDLFALVIEKVTGLTDLQDIFIQKHFLNFLVFLAGAWALYRIAVRRFQSRRWGLVALLMLVLSPRLFADGFYNAKDIIFMSFFTFALLTGIRWSEHSTICNALLHALATAIAIDTRIMGIILIPLTFLFFVVKNLNRKIVSKQRLFVNLSVFVVATAAFVIVFWPMLWSDPVNNFIYAFTRLSRYETWSKEVLYMGQYIMSTELPWHYILGWMLVTTPIVFQASFLGGFLMLVKRVVWKHKMKFWKHDDDLHDLLLLSTIIGPLISIILFRSIVYDGWRHLYFIYPGFIILAVYGLNRFWQRISNQTAIKRLTVLAITFSLAMNAFWMFQAHPLQNVYFNALMGKNWKVKFELDYWGLANRAAMEYVLANDVNPVIHVSAVSAANLYQTFFIINEKDRSRLQYHGDFGALDLSQFSDSNPLYVFNNFKRLKDHDILANDANFRLFYEKRIQNEIIVQVYKYIG